MGGRNQPSLIEQLILFLHLFNQKYLYFKNKFQTWFRHVRIRAVNAVLRIAIHTSNVRCRNEKEILFVVLIFFFFKEFQLYSIIIKSKSNSK